LRIESRPAFPPVSASLRRQAKQKNFLYIFLIARPQKFFQLKKRKFFRFAFLLTEEKRKLSHPNRAFGAESASGQKLLPSLPFCPFAYSLASRARRQGFLLKSAYCFIFYVFAIIYFLDKTIPFFLCYFLA